MAEIPMVQTERLVLRALRFADWPGYFDMMASDRARYMGGPMDRAKAWGVFCHDAAQWALLGHGALMIERREDGKCLGQVTVNAGPLFPEHELGWFLYPFAEGGGFALEAAAAMRKWAIDVAGVPSLVSYVDPENQRSRRLAERLGATLDPEAERLSPSDLVYRHAVHMRAPEER